MASSLDANLDLSPECLSKDVLKSSDVMIFDTFSIETENGFNTVKESIEIANINNVDVCYGISDKSLISLSYEKISWIFSKNISYVYGNQDEINELRNTITFNDEIVITTFGDKGASVGDLKVSAKSITPISTNGAGDALIGVFMALKGEYLIIKMLFKGP